MATDAESPNSLTASSPVRPPQCLGEPALVFERSRQPRDGTSVAGLPEERPRIHDGRRSSGSASAGLCCARSVETSVRVLRDRRRLTIAVDPARHLRLPRERLRFGQPAEVAEVRASRTAGADVG
jgi:hypothetical protein